MRENGSSGEIGEEAGEKSSTVGMSAVTSSIRPAPLPISAMAMVTRPRMIRGMEKLRNSPKMELKVTNSRTKGVGRKFPIAIPSIIAMMIRGKSPMCIFFITSFRSLLQK